MRLRGLPIPTAPAGCAAPVAPVAGVPPSTPVRWKAADCMAHRPLDGTAGREALAVPCRNAGAHGFMALSGGGPRTALSGEALFRLQALGLLQQAGCNRGASSCASI